MAIFNSYLYVHQRVVRWFHSTFDDTDIAMSSPSHAQGVCAESLETWNEVSDIAVSFL